MKKELLIAIALVLLLVSFFFDAEIASSAINYRTEFLTSLAHSMSFIGSTLAVIILTTILFLTDRRKREYIPVLLISIIAAAALAFVLKYIVARPRPNLFPLEVKNSYSFPSGHAAAFFSALALIDSQFPKLKWFWCSIGILVMLSRVYLGVHYMSDVIAGALIGYVIGILVLLITKKHT